MNKRVETLRKKMLEAGLESLLITNLINVRYLTGFTGTTGIAVITEKAHYFISDARYKEQASLQCKAFTFMLNTGNAFLEVVKIMEQEKLSSIAFEESLSYADYLYLEEIVPIHCELTHFSGLIEEMRAIKEEEEIETIRKACSIADRGFLHILNFIQAGKTEIEVANELDFYMRSLGASGVSFETIVASGVRSAMPHGVAGNKVLQEHDLITLDFGCFYNDYVSDMTRNVSIGTVDERLEEMFDVLHLAQQTAVQNVQGGLKISAYDKFARDILKKHGYDKQFTHSIGHGIGLEIHEAPQLGAKSTDVLQAGQVITCEPGVYLEGLGGARIEDDLLVTSNGYEVLTQSERKLIVL